MALVYQAVNIINGKRYIGVTSATLKRRRCQHLSDARKGKRLQFHASIRKHGEEFFRFSVVTRCVSMDDAREFERRLIAAWRPAYNLTAGGEGTSGYKMRPEVKAAMIARLTGQPAHNRGSKHTPEALDKMRAWHAANPDRKPNLGQKHPGRGLKGRATRMARGTDRNAIIARWRPVICVDDGIIFRSVAAAAHHYGCRTPSISRACNGGRKSFRGKAFVYAEAA